MRDDSAGRHALARNAAPAARSRCMLCGRTSDIAVYEEGGYRACTCACGMVFVDPWPGRVAAEPVDA